MAVGVLGARYEMNTVRTMMLEEVAMENWPKTSEWLEFPFVMGSAFLKHSVGENDIHKSHPALYFAISFFMPINALA